MSSTINPATVDARAKHAFSLAKLNEYNAYAWSAGDVVAWVKGLRFVREQAKTFNVASLESKTPIDGKSLMDDRVVSEGWCEHHLLDSYVMYLAISWLRERNGFPGCRWRYDLKHNGFTSPTKESRAAWFAEFEQAVQRASDPVKAFVTTAKQDALAVSALAYVSRK